MNLFAFRQEVATPQTSIQLCVLGILGGISAASLIILFRLSVQWLQLQFLDAENQFSSLPPIYRLIIPCIAAIIIVLIGYLTGFKHYRMGIPFVIHRVKQRFGIIPIRTTINQFFGGAVALASGFSVGREGPSVHLGAAGSSFLGQWLKLPYNSIRILAGCGIAAGISASFNTPFAAVIFVMEVVLREYKIHIFIPVMLAAACGSVLTRIVFADAQELAFMHFESFNQWIYLYLILFGIVLGTLATAFNNALMMVIRGFKRINMARRLLVAGLITGAVGYFLPEALGAHFYSAHDLINQETITVLLAVLAAKFLLTIVAIGLGIPGGVIGPVFVIGMLSGALLAAPLIGLSIEGESLTGSFAMLGMAGLLSAVVHAPLAALSAVMELSYSPEIVLPAILVIVPAYVTSTQFFGNSSIFIRQLDYQKLPYATTSVIEALQKTGSIAVMAQDFKLYVDAPEHILRGFLEANPTHLLVHRSSFEIDVQFSLVQFNLNLGHDQTPLKMHHMNGVSSQSTLAEVYQLLEAKREGAVYVYQDEAHNVIGVITWNTLRSYLHKAHY